MLIGNHTKAITSGSLWTELSFHFQPAPHLLTFKVWYSFFLLGADGVCQFSLQTMSFGLGRHINICPTLEASTKL